MPRRQKLKATATAKANRHFLRQVSVNISRLPRPNLAVLKRSGMGVAWLAAVAAVGAGWVFGVPKLYAYAAQRRQVNPRDVAITFFNPPEMPKELWDNLMRTATLQVRGNPLERDDLVAIRQALLETGWFDFIQQVRRVRDDAVEIHAQFVRPCTFIRDSTGDHLIDSSGKLLPLSVERNAKLKFKPITITGVHFPRPRQVGMVWEGADVAAALKLLALFQQQPWRKQITEIDVSGFLKDQPIKLRTDNGCTIVWGGAPGEELALEVLAAGKLQRLDFLFKRYGRIDRGLTGELDITTDKAVVSR